MPKWSKQDYTMVAKAIEETFRLKDTTSIWHVIAPFQKVFGDDNPHFDQTKFRLACIGARKVV
jgi:hypothetical protein